MSVYYKCDLCGKANFQKGEMYTITIKKTDDSYHDGDMIPKDFEKEVCCKCGKSEKIRLNVKARDRP